MRILTINVIGIPSGSSDNLISANVFQDYDAAVVDPENLERLYGDTRNIYDDRDEGILKYEAGSAISAVNEKRHGQVISLLRRGGVVVCFMQSLERYSYNLSYEGEERWVNVTNYDWFLKPTELLKLEYSTGITIDNIDSGHPFAEYLNIKPSWSAYVDMDACKDWKVLASAFGTHALALTKRVGLGHIVLLPSSYDYRYGELMESCIIKLLGDKEVIPQPSWARSILVPGQPELISKLTEVNEQTDALEQKRKASSDDIAKLERWKYLLYEKGKHRLEPVVREALATLGCRVEPQPDKDSDGVVVCDYGTALLEVVGSKGTVKIEKLGELIKNIGNYISEKGSAASGILVGNPFCEEPLDNRPPKGSQKVLFAKELIESAEKQSIPVLLSTDLYQIVCDILKGKLSEEDLKSLQKRIFAGRGLVRLVE